MNVWFCKYIRVFQKIYIFFKRYIFGLRINNIYICRWLCEIVHKILFGVETHSSLSHFPTKMIKLNNSQL